MDGAGESEDENEDNVEIQELSLLLCGNKWSNNIHTHRNMFSPHTSPSNHGRLAICRDNLNI